MTVNKILRIKNGMSIEELMTVMCDNNYEAMKSIAEIFALNAGMAHLVELDIMGIYGAKLNEFWKVCCKSDEENLHIIMQKLFSEEFTDITDEEIRENLTLICEQILAE